ncbi:DUF6429 family protein [Cupriavidus sp. AcVe19-6a]|uniref:DUF6429 family protein n=1 Tax=Cupriavidus sp. AcVe19-6a TaxID=2821358 RepID=UPI001FD7FDD3|nr:DUF6429 family protein [Cupriavidus sp. AcVe19-6a]
MDINTDAVEEVVLALLHLNLCGENRAWKRLDWNALSRLYDKGFIGDPVNRAKSVWLTDEGLQSARAGVIFVQKSGGDPEKSISNQTVDD